jgi:hypothetical protein
VSVAICSWLAVQGREGNDHSRRVRSRPWAPGGVPGLAVAWQHTSRSTGAITVVEAQALAPRCFANSTREIAIARPSPSSGIRPHAASRCATRITALRARASPTRSTRRTRGSPFCTHSSCDPRGHASDTSHGSPDPGQIAEAKRRRRWFRKRSRAEPAEPFGAYRWLRWLPDASGTASDYGWLCWPPEAGRESDHQSQ